MKRTRTLILVLAVAAIVPGLAHARRAPQAPLPSDTPVHAIVVKFDDDAGVRMAPSGRLMQKPAIARGVSSASLQASFLAIEAQARSRGLALNRHFSLQSEDQLDRWVARGRERGRILADLNSYYSLALPAGTRYSQVAQLIQTLASLPHVETAYAATVAPPPQGAASPDFEASQGYLDAAPNGIDARFGWAMPGGRGASVRIIDVEYAWFRGHEDLPDEVVDSGNDYVNPADDFTDDHGTAVVGILAAMDNDIGGTGIVSDAEIGLSAVHPVPNNPQADVSVAEAILWAAQNANAGDFILIEQQVYGIGAPPCPCGLTCPNLLPVEFEQANFDAIETAVANSIIVVEAAGNGSNNLDSALYQGVFAPGPEDSGAIMVGAAMSTERTPMCFSNHGSRVDVHAWGENVHTTGYGSWYPGGSPHLGTKYFWYRNDFGGTSSASPIVTGAAAIIQGVRAAASQTRLTPAQMRALLVATGTAQTGQTANHIGPMPNVRAAIRSSNSGTLNLDWLPAVLSIVLGD
jgi:subtilisin family serine protease